MGEIVKKIVVAIASLGLMAGVATPAQAVQSSAKSYSNCDQLLKKYPNGVAKSKSAAAKAVKSGNARPKISGSLYKTNGKRLDRDKDGVMCEQEGARTISFKTDFGFITAQEVKAPKAGECVNVPVAIDVRNLGPVGTFGMTVRLISEFGSVFGYEEISTDQRVQYPYIISEPGNLNMSLKTCADAHAWTHPSGGRQEQVAGVRTDERMALVFYRWLGDVQLGSAEYSFV